MKTTIKKRVDNRNIIVVEISIGDIGENGYDCINVYSSNYSLDKRMGGETIEFEGKTYYMDGCGSDDKLITKHFPELKPVVLINGCDIFGFHSYPIQNTKYYLKNDKEYAKKAYRLTDEEVNLFVQLNDIYLAKNMYRIYKERYTKEVNEAIKIIEGLCGEKYKHKEHISHQLENDIVYCITSAEPERTRGWNLLKGKEKPIYYSINLEI